MRQGVQWWVNWSQWIRWSQVAFLFHQSDVRTFLIYTLHEKHAHSVSKLISVQAVNIHSWWKVSHRNASHRPATNELTVELPRQPAPRFLIDEPQMQPKHQEVAAATYTSTRSSCSPTNVPAAVVHPEHSDCLLLWCKCSLRVNTVCIYSSWIISESEKHFTVLRCSLICLEIWLWMPYKQLPLCFWELDPRRRREWEKNHAHIKFIF